MVTHINENEPIAIIGASCRFPGNATSLEKFWQIMKERKDLSQKIIDRAFNADGFYHPVSDHAGTTSAINAYFLESDPTRFDAAFFGMNNLDAQAADPQQRQALEVVYEALVEAGQTMMGIDGSQTSVYSGTMTSDHEHTIFKDFDQAPKYAATGTGRAILSNRISYFFNLHGPSMTVDTACSSSLVALHQAVQSLRSGESSMSIVTGTNLLVSPEMFIGETNLPMLGVGGKSRMWSKDADGYARGEGVAAVVLKTLSQAIKDNDTVDGIIRATGVNQDGRTKGITMPSAEAQEALIRSTYEKAQLSLSDTQYFEAHGTGTRTGDPLESTAVRKVFSKFHTPESPLYVGSVKTNIGHTEGTAGLAGILKVMLALRHRTIPANLHFTELNPDVILENMQVPVEETPWPDSGNGPLRASVNSFGFGGTNAHAVLEASPMPVKTQDHTPRRRLFRFSAKTEDALKRELLDLSDHIDTLNEIDLDDLAYTLNERRDVFNVRTTVSATNTAEAVREMRLKADNPTRSFNTVVDHREASLIFVFTGQGCQWATMAKQLILSDKLFESSIDSCEEALSKLPDPPSWNLKSELLAEKAVSRINESHISQPLCAAVQIALVDRLRLLGIVPDAVVGHSSGEIGAAYCANVLSARDAIVSAYYRGKHMNNTKLDNPGAMMAVGLDLESAENVCKDFIGRVCVAAINSPSSITLSGDKSAILELRAVMEAKGIFARLLMVSTAYHSHHMLEYAQDYLESLNAAGIEARRPSTRWVSSVTGKLITSPVPTSYWVDNMISKVRFAPALQCILAGLGADILMEVGPHPALKGPVRQILQKDFSSAKYLNLLSRHEDDGKIFSENVGHLWEFNRSIDWTKIDSISAPGGCFVLKGLPKYPFNHTADIRVESRLSMRYRQREYTSDMIGTRRPDDFDQEMRWRVILRLSELPWLEDHKIQGSVLFPAAGFVAMALEAISKSMVQREHAVSQFVLTNIKINKALLINSAPVEIIITFKPNSEYKGRRGGAFAVYSCSDIVSNRFDQHCDGYVFVDVANTLPDSHPITDITQRSVDTAEFYARLAKIGLEYGPQFQGCSSVSCGAGTSKGIVRSPKIAAYQTQHILHPTVLDSAFQLVFAALPGFAGNGRLDTFIPTSIDILKVSASLLSSKTPSLVVHARTVITAGTKNVFTAHLEAFPENGSSSTATFCVYGLQCSKLSGDATNQLSRELYFTTKFYAAAITPLTIGTADHPLGAVIRLLTARHPTARLAQYISSNQKSLFGEVEKIAGKKFANYTHLFQDAKSLNTFERMSLNYGRRSSTEILGISKNQDLIIIDAASLDLSHTDKFLRSLKIGGYLAIVGDINQCTRHEIPGPDFLFQGLTKGRLTSVGLYVKVDEKMKALVEPLDNTFRVTKPTYIVGGSNDGVAKLITYLRTILTAAKVVTTLSDLSSDLSPETIVINLSDTEQVNFDRKDANKQFEALKRVLSSVGFFLHITEQSLSWNYRQCLTIGLLRTARNEFDGLSLVTFDIANFVSEDKLSQVASVIASVAIQTVIAKNIDHQKYLWTSETEYTYTNGRLQLLRIEANSNLNDQLESEKHLVVRRQLLDVESSYALDNSSGDMKKECWTRRAIPQPITDHVGARIEMATLSNLIKDAGSVGFGYVTKVHCSVLGIEPDDRVVCFVDETVSSSVQIRPQNVHVLGPCEDPLRCITFVAEYMTAAAIINKTDSGRYFKRNQRALAVTVDDCLGLAVYNLAKHLGVRVRGISKNPSKTLEDVIVLRQNTPNLLIERSLGLFKPDVLVITNLNHDMESIIPVLSPGCQLVDLVESLSFALSQNARQNKLLVYTPQYLQYSAKDLSQSFSTVLKLWYSSTMRASTVSVVPADRVSDPSLQNNPIVVVDFTRVESLPVKIEPLNHAGLFAQNKCYILAGCNGGLGKLIAKLMAQNNAGHIAIISRSGVGQDFVQELEACGAKVWNIRASISDRGKLFQALTALEAALPTGVEIGGIANMAMVLQDSMLDRTSFDDIQAVFAPKVQGSQNLHDWSLGKSLDFFIMYSSIAAVFGNRGQAAYAAANRFQVGLNGYRRALGLVSSVVDLGVVVDVGAANDSGVLEGALRSWLAHPITASDCLHIFGELVTVGKDFSLSNTNLITGFPSHGHIISEQYWHSDPQFSHLLVDETGTTSADACGVKKLSLKDKISTLVDAHEIQSAIEPIFLEELAHILQTSVQALNTHNPIVDYGLDSLMAVEIRSFFSTKLGVQIPIFKILGGSTVSDLLSTVAQSLVANNSAVINQVQDNAYKIDWERETTIDIEALLGRIEPVSKKTSSRLTIVLTGSTGFLGTHLLARLIQDPSVATVHCIAVRAKSPDLALGRLEAQLKKYRQWNQDTSAAMDKIIAWPGAMNQIDLGLDADALLTIASTADYIVNNAAEVNFLKPFSALRQVNVLSISYLLKLQKMAGNVPMAYTSTAGVAYVQPAQKNPDDLLRDEQPLDSYTPNTSDEQEGYVKSKWCAEAVMHKAARSSHKCAIRIHRPAEIIGNTETFCPEPQGDVVQALLQYYTDTGAIPTSRFDGRLPVFDFIPVNYVAYGMVRCIMKELHGRKPLDTVAYFHHCNSAPLDNAQMGQLLGTLRGRELAEVSDDWWIQNAKSKMSELQLDPVLLYMVEDVIKAPAIPIKLSRSVLDMALDSEEDQKYKTFSITPELVRTLVLGGTA